MGWAIAIFGDCLKVVLFTEATKDEWWKFYDGMIKRRLWLQEKVREILGSECEWMLRCPNCI